MNLISFEREGRDSFGIVTDGGVIDAGARLKGEFSGLREIIAAGAVNLLRGMEGLPRDFSEDDIRFRPVIPDASKIICVGLNYLSHIKEMDRALPEYPVVFTRFADSVVGHLQPMLLPPESDRFDYEGELAVIIGKRARRVSAANALDYVAGYSCYNDGSIRDYQNHTHQFTPGKNFHASGAFGPWLATSDGRGDPTEFHLQTRLNGEVMQDAPVDDLYFDVPQLIEYCSSWAQLEPGDVIVTGTPGGVGAARKPPVWMKAGDVVEVDIRGVGLLRNPIVAESTT